MLPSHSRPKVRSASRYTGR